jgi:hypothetical protein
MRHRLRLLRADRAAPRQARPANTDSAAAMEHRWRLTAMAIDGLWTERPSNKNYKMTYKMLARLPLTN